MRRYTFLTCCFFGWNIAYKMADSSMRENEWYTRPDFKPYPAMVKQEDMLWDPKVAKQMDQHKYGLLKGQKDRGNLYRFFFPNNASYEPIYNGYANSDPSSSY